MSTAGLHARSASLSECGHRRVNQDAVLVTTLSDGRELAAVADGMGGHAGGEIASRLALTTLRTALEEGADLDTSVQAANYAVFTMADTQAELKGMGTTVVAALRTGDTYHVANVGDSRAYLIDGDGITQLSQDHSFVAEAVRSGHLSAQQAGRSQWRNAVTRAVGTEPTVEVDVFGPFPARPEQALLLCTDGLYRAVADDQLMRSILTAPSPAHAVRELVYAALAGGSDDNISAALLAFGAGPPARSAMQPSGNRWDGQPAAQTPPAHDDKAASPPARAGDDGSASQPASAGQSAAPGAATGRAVVGAIARERLILIPEERRRRPHRRVRWTLRGVMIIFGGLVLAILYAVWLRSAF